MENIGDQGAVYDLDTLDDLVAGLNVVAHVGLVTERLVKSAESKPKLARLLNAEMFMVSGVSVLGRASQLIEALGEVLPRLGEGRLASAADALLSISPEYRGQSFEQRSATAAAIWRPGGYAEQRHFYRPRMGIIRAVAAELVNYQDEKLFASSRTNEMSSTSETYAMPIQKALYTRMTRDGKLQTRYAIRGNYQGRWLTKFIGRDDWNALSLSFYDIKTRQIIIGEPAIIGVPLVKSG